MPFPSLASASTQPRFGVALALEGVAGLSLGSDYEASCGSSARCGDRSRPLGGAIGGRLYVVARDGLAFGVRGGYLAIRAKLAREASLLGDASVPVGVDLVEAWSLDGPFVAIDAAAGTRTGDLSLEGRIGVGVLFGRARLTRTGNALDVVDQVGASPPAARALFDSAATSRGAVPFVVAEASAAWTIASRVRLGVTFGAIAGATTLRPEIQTTARTNPSLDGSHAPSVAGANGSPPRPIGAVPTFAFGADAEAAVGTFVLPKLGLEMIAEW